MSTLSRLLIDFLFVLVVLLGIAGGGYFWWTQQQLKSLTTDMATKNIQIAEQIKTIDDYKKQLDLVQKLNQGYNSQINIIRSQADQLRRQLITLQSNAASNPRETEKLINARYQQIFDDLVKLSEGK